MKIVKARIYLVNIAGRHPVLVELITDASNMQVQPHLCASPVATAAALQVDACMRNLLIQELYPYRVPEHFDLVDHAPERDVKGGRLAIPDRPGLGVALVPERVRSHLWAECE